MNIKITYENGRIESFDTADLTGGSPFGNRSMMTEFDILLDQLDRGIVVDIHCYEDVGETNEEHAEPEAAARRMGRRFTLADAQEANRILEIDFGNDVCLWRLGDALVGGPQFSYAVQTFYAGDPSASRNQKAIWLYQYFLSAFPEASEDPEELCSRFGFTEKAYRFAYSLESLQCYEDSQEVEE